MILLWHIDPVKLLFHFRCFRAAIRISAQHGANNLKLKGKKITTNTDLIPL